MTVAELWTEAPKVYVCAWCWPPNPDNPEHRGHRTGKCGCTRPECKSASTMAAMFNETDTIEDPVVDVTPAPVAPAPAANTATRECGTCGKAFTKKPGPGRWPRVCYTCKEASVA